MNYENYHLTSWNDDSEYFTDRWIESAFNFVA